VARLITGLNAEVVRANLGRVRTEIASTGRDPDMVEILAATKYVAAEELGVLAEAGIDLVGENRAQDLLAKQQTGPASFTWDFIGHLQSRKVRDLVGRVRLIHAVDSHSACQQIDTRREPGATIDCLLQVNVAGEDSKAGVAPAAVDAFLEGVEPFAGVRFRGLMTMPPAVSDPEQARPWFEALRDLRDRLGPRWAGRHEFTHLSMGTSQDFAVAAQEGATIVRVGGVLYGR
jgi:pyridoxal phosphate enzyme (YggS family)